MSNFSILTYEQVIGMPVYQSSKKTYPGKIEFFNGNDRGGSVVELSDFAVLRGAKVSSYYYSKSWRHKQAQELKKHGHEKNALVPCGIYWLQDATGPFNHQRTETKHDYWGDIESEYTYYPYNSNTDVMLSNSKGCCPSYTDIVNRISVSYDEIENKCTKKERDELDGVLEVEYGEYPQSLAPKEIQDKLENAYNNGSLEETGKTYTTDKVYKEYEYNRKKYIRIDVKIKDTYKKDDKEYKNNDNAWIEVEPIKWWVDEKLNLAFTEKGFLTGQAFHIGIGYNGNFQNTTTKKYLDKSFAKDIIPSKLKPKKDYQVVDILNSDYDNQELKQLTIDEKRNVIASLEKEVKEILDKLRIFAEELDPELGKVFDQEIKKEKEKNKQKVKVKVKVKEK